MREKNVNNYKNLIFVAHSMGGLIVRGYILRVPDIAKKTRLLYLYSTPSSGSQFAEMAKKFSANASIAMMSSMRGAYGSYLRQQEADWLRAQFKIPTFCAVERRPLGGSIIVDQASSANMCTKEPNALDFDHVTIVKPQSVNSEQYRVFKSAVEETPFERAGNAFEQ